VALGNPRLAALITRRIGETWVRNMEGELRRLEAWADDAEFQSQWRQVKHGNKADLARLVKERTGIVVDPESLFDIQVKRLHEYKRQHLNVLHIVALYNRLKNSPGADMTPRTFIFGGKAAPGYFMAKLIIKLINAVGEVVNGDPDVAGRLRVVFFPDFNVKNSQSIYPAADLSEQISTAGKEASGTGNMKFTMNGALTIGTLDGANVEIREEVGAENFFLFGHTVEQVAALKAGGYRPGDIYESHAELRQAIDRLASGHFSRGDGSLFRPLVDSLIHADEYMLMADFGPYVECQDRVSAAFRDSGRWTRMSILNTARSGKFSSDRSIRDYCERIWKVKPVRVALA
jgi:starch phosphorylase